MPIRFRILGPLEVVADGGEVRLGGQKPRALLALLLLHPNEVVPADRLVDELWGGDSREAGAGPLRVEVARLHGQRRARRARSPSLRASRRRGEGLARSRPGSRRVTAAA